MWTCSGCGEEQNGYAVKLSYGKAEDNEAYERGIIFNDAVHSETILCKQCALHWVETLEEV